MARDWGSLFTNWAKPFSDTTEEKADRAVRMIREAIRSSAKLSGKSVKIYTTGSYRNNTNTKLESDVDVAVVLHDCFFYQLPASGSPTAADLGLGKGVDYGFADFREDVGKALVDQLGRAGVTPGDKSFDVHENTARIDADASCFLLHRRYSGRKNADGSWHYS